MATAGNHTVFTEFIFQSRLAAKFISEPNANHQMTRTSCSCCRLYTYKFYVLEVAHVQDMYMLYVL